LAGSQHQHNRVRAGRKHRDAFLWNFTVLGEAAAQLPKGPTERFPEVPWKQPSMLGNRIVHGYWSIDMNVLQTTAQDQLPNFADQLREVLSAVLREEADKSAAPPGSDD
jgi:uncharacterized protein with HEPN domain